MIQYEDEGDATLFNVLKRKLVIGAILFCFLMSILIPNEKQLAYLIGGYVATNNEQLAKLPNNILNLANKYLDKYAKLLDDEEKTKKSSK